MNIADVVINRTTGMCLTRERIPAGIVGATVNVHFADPIWDDLEKKVVFRGNELSKIADKFDGTTAVIPAEVVAEPGTAIYFGIWGYEPEGGLQLPLIEVRLGRTERATEPGSDPDADPDLPIWAQLLADVEKLKGAGLFEPAAYGLPVLTLSGDVSQISKENAVALDYTYGDRSGSCTLKWQGNSSLAYPKKNYTVKFDQSFEAAEGWGEQKKYCLKADFIDFSHARNVVSAKLWGKVVRARSNGTVSQIASLPNGGAVDGFPCVVMINGEYTGIYNFNIPKDEWMFGMGDGEAEAILCAESFAFDTAAAVDGTDLELEYVTDEDDCDWVAESLNRLVSAVLNSDGTDIDSTIAQYLDIASAIDYMIFTVLQYGTDNTTKNYILATYDGVKWFFSVYDMDGTWGLRWDGKSYYSAALNVNYSAGSLKGFANKHKLMELLYTYKFDAIQKRYNELREGVLSQAAVEKEFLNYASAIPKALFDQEVLLWPTIPGTMTNNVHQIIGWYQNRCAVMDADVGVYESTGVTYSPEIAGFIRTNGTVSTSANYKRTDYLPLDGVTEAEYVSFCVANSAMATWALFDADQTWLVSSTDITDMGYTYPTIGGGTSSVGLMRNTISIAQLLADYPTAAYIVLSTNNNASYETLTDADGNSVGWGSAEQYITLR